MRAGTMRDIVHDVHENALLELSPPDSAWWKPLLWVSALRLPTLRSPLLPLFVQTVRDAQKQLQGDAWAGS